MQSSRDFTSTRQRLGSLGVLLLAVTATLGCREPTAVQSSPELAARLTAAEPDVVMISFPADFVLQLSCLGEAVHWTGEVKIHGFRLTNQGSDFIQHYQFSQLDVLDGVGLETGEVYQWRARVAEALQSESTENEYPVTYWFTSWGVVTSPGSGLLRQLQFRVAFVVNADNEVVVDESSLSFRCPDA